jgi:hypothetical protein
VLGADGRPVAGRAIHMGERTADDRNNAATQDGTTGADGTVSFPVTNRTAPRIVIKETGDEGPRVVSIDLKAQQPCIFHVLAPDAFERSTRDDYETFLRNSCLDDKALAAVRKVGLDFSGGGKPLYDPNDNTIHGIGLGDDYDELMRGLIHELGHGMIARAIDPDKDVGGPHNNWEPVDPKKVKAGTAEQLAFEEGAADFLAMLYFRMHGQVYQKDLEDDVAAGHAIEANGKDASARTESVITRYLWSVYQPIIDGPDGPQKALADFLQTMTYEQRNAGYLEWGVKPARTIQDFIAARVKRAGDAKEGQRCGFAPVDLDKMRRLGDAYGVATIPRVNIEHRDGGDTLAMATPGVHDIPAGGAVVYQHGDVLGSGKIARTRVGGAGPATVSVDPDGGVTVKSGTAIVTDGSARTESLEVVPMGTAYIVRVEGDKQTVAVAHGKVEVTERAGAKRKVTVEEGKAVDWGAKDGFTAPRDGKEDLVRGKPEPAGAGGGGSSAFPFKVVAAIAIVLVLLVAAWRVKRKG